MDTARQTEKLYISIVVYRQVLASCCHTASKPQGAIGSTSSSNTVKARSWWKIGRNQTLSSDSNSKSTKTGHSSYAWRLDDKCAVNFFCWTPSFCVIFKAVRYWSCPLSRNRDRIIPHRPSMLKWAQTCEKSVTKAGLEPTTSFLLGRCSTGWATAADD